MFVKYKKSFEDLTKYITFFQFLLKKNYYFFENFIYRKYKNFIEPFHFALLIYFSGIFFSNLV